MSKRKNKPGDFSEPLDANPRIDSELSGLPAEGKATRSDLSGETGPLVWSRLHRQVASLAIIAYLAVLLLGPLSNPIGSPHFSLPLAGKIGPIHRALFLGHGYRFFAPDPGPTHRVLYRGIRADGTEFSGHFPDRDQDWPRLLYHRWFMLSETLFNEQVLRPSAVQFEQRKLEYDRQILRLRTEGKRQLLDQLIRERDLEAAFFERTTARFEMIVSAVARVLLQRNEGTSIELFVQERKIPFPEEVVDGLRLDAESLLLDPVKIGELDADGFRTPQPTEPLPARKESP